VAGIHGDGPVPGFRPDLIVLKQLRISGPGVRTFRSSARSRVLSSRRYPFDRIHAHADLEGLPALLESWRVSPARPLHLFAALVIDELG